jgi:hypothetical protein
MATLSVQNAARSANDLTLSTATDGGDDFVSTGVEKLLVVSSSASTVTMTVPVTQTVDGEAVDDKTIDIGAGETALLGPWPRNIYGDSENKVSFSFGGDYADIDVAVIN